MHGNIQPPSQGAISGEEAFFHRWKNFSEPLWFAVMCRELWGPNAPKELRFIFGDGWTERTYRAWASGDSIPPATIFVALLFGAGGHRFLAYVMRDGQPRWWADMLEDQRQAAILRAAMREVAGVG